MSLAPPTVPVPRTPGRPPPEAPRSHPGTGAAGRAAFWTVTRTGVLLRPMTPAEAVPARDFLVAQYEAFNAVDNTDEGHATFRDFVAPDALRRRLDAGNVTHLAERDGAILGLCELHRDGYLTLLYVRGDHQGRGLGRRLLRCGLARLLALEPETRQVRVRATPYARRFYLRAGFEPLTDTVQDDHGIRFYPLALRITDDRGGADTPRVSDT
ncbi:GNAT family N-acetyltransferase [Roseospira navarrensis]|uniref:GNAT family N-acetyltransferase n=1 Tax=Roseospira navarrensis TaxID=140058 RepID=A0A7X2D2T5_9PROT|nr:GNAT family N-acetyltransferase [Roseospira navarrensis]MQX36609.1 GNAT family N-acetyltransferase [Roseospira navarrensis]